MLMCEHNYQTIRNFIDDFLENANDDDAIYLIEVLMSACKFASEHKDKVDKFVAEKKRTKTCFN